MKKLSIIGLFIFALLNFNGCKSEDDVVFIANNNDELVFTNSFLSEYLISFATSSNIAERFTWQSADVGVPTNVVYTLQKSITGDFTDAENVGTSSGNEIALTVGDFVAYAVEAGSDDDPNTDAPNSVDVYFRLQSTVGSGEANFSPTQTITITWLENTGADAAVCDLDQLWLVGAGVTFANWSWETPQQAKCSGNGVYSGNIAFTSDNDANFRFFTANADWGSGQNYPFFADAGYTIDSRFENAMDGDQNFLFTGDSGLYYLVIDTVNKTITLDAPTATGECDLDILYGVGFGLTDADWSWETPVQLVCEGNGIYQGWVNYRNEGDANFRFFTANADWGSGLNYPHYADAGYTIDPKLTNAMDGDNNFMFIGETGQYFTIIDTVNKTITLE
ncbi:SusE-like outer membrane protein [Winogradskyella wandonensis]|uniref:SusE-like outer membrane protein n=1 Tax=Winogradskyella wandonensis TaxID=1442586 RepID=A0A4R1KLN6_9FLAO|nr:SusE domain-containing protein [Winogradskyella wandonensis]TCK65190.1 SusE-like outer membrane protein [Winogradskyella wandonensis]